MSKLLIKKLPLPDTAGKIIALTNGKVALVSESDFPKLSKYYWRAVKSHHNWCAIRRKIINCDGNNGTPNLKDKFVIGAGDTYDPDDEGGSLTHDHDFTSDGHNHTIPAGAGIGAGPAISTTTTTDADTGTTEAGSSLPPYYALCYIMKT